MEGFIFSTILCQYGKIEKGSEFTARNVLLLFKTKVVLKKDML